VPLTPGARLGVYEVVAEIGEGGMGKVYRALDTTLGRQVAIKVLPDAFAQDAERLARFEREARTLASLNHPNIAQIYGLEKSGDNGALIMELVEGEDLSQRIAGGPIPWAEAFPIAKQIAEALEVAHEQGIIHRDLKPANIKVTPAGVVKVLDFGLAKLADTGPANAKAGHYARDGSVRLQADLTMSPTITSPAAMTEMGVLLGTAAYMAPEQARGRSVDRRADIWAFGCVLFEMLAGRRPFDGENVADTLGAIIHREPAWSVLPTSTPPVVRELLQRCLDKDPKQRLRDIGDARFEIDKALRTSVADETTDGRSAPASRSRTALAGWLVAMPLGLVAAGVGFLHFTERPADTTSAVRFEIAPPENTNFLTGGIVSADGRLVAFAARDDRGLMTIWVRSLDSLEARPLPGTETSNIGRPFFWSPDSRFIGYAADGKLKKVAVSGGAPQTLADLEGLTAAQYRGGDWSRDGVVIFGLQGKGLRRVPAEGGTASVLTNVDPSRESSHVEPVFLPDGRRFLYTRLANEREQSGVYVGTLDAGGESASPRRLLLAISGAVFAPSPNPNVGQLLFVRGRTLMIQPFDAARVQLAGEAEPLAENMPDLGARAFSASTTGVLTFKSVGATSGSRLIWFDRQGKSLGEVGPPAPYGDIVLAPDDRTLVVWQREPQTDTPHLWIIDLQRQVRSRLNPGDQRDYAPAVSHDGRIVFTVESSGAAGDLFIRAASGAGDPEPLLKSTNTKHPNDWSASGRFIMYDEHHPSRLQDMWVLPLAGDRKPIPFLTTPADEAGGQFSPDDRWVVYSSNESGRREVYVRDFAPDRSPAVGSARITISTAGGATPRWRPDGKEIYYIAPGGKMMAVPVKLGPTFEAGVAVPLFDINATGFFSYDVTADGRFLVNTLAEQDSASSPPITVVVNWQAALKK
jgi:serine/threonine protein kinase/Tol biopolymer transport system component